MAMNSTNPAIRGEIFDTAYFACIANLGLYEAVHDDDSSLTQKPRVLAAKPFTPPMCGCCCMVLSKYLASLMLLQYNFWCKPLLRINSSSRTHLE